MGSDWERRAGTEMAYTAVSNESCMLTNCIVLSSMLLASTKRRRPPEERELEEDTLGILAESGNASVAGMKINATNSQCGHRTPFDVARKTHMGNILWEK
jgi:hypothetical protein